MFWTPAVLCKDAIIGSVRPGYFKNLKNGDYSLLETEFFYRIYKRIDLYKDGAI